LEAALAARDSLIAVLRVRLAQLRCMISGQSSEKLSLQNEQLELALEELEGQAELARGKASFATLAHVVVNKLASLALGQAHALEHFPRSQTIAAVLEVVGAFGG